MGYHLQNNALQDTTLDLEHPEVLVHGLTIVLHIMLTKHLKALPT
jgi:hypothetical protein